MNTNILWIAFYALLWGYAPFWFAASVNLSLVVIGFSINSMEEEAREAVESAREMWEDD